MIDPFVLRGIDVNLGAKRALIDGTFCALIHNRALLTRERNFFGVIFQEILANFRANFFKQKAKVRKYWIVAPY